MMARVQISLDPELQRRAQRRAARALVCRVRARCYHARSRGPAKEGKRFARLQSGRFGTGHGRRPTEGRDDSLTAKLVRSTIEKSWSRSAALCPSLWFQVRERASLKDWPPRNDGPAPSSRGHTAAFKP